MACDEQTKRDVETCERALGELLQAIVRHDRERDAQRTGPSVLKIFSVDEIKLDRLAFEALTEDPVRQALREGVKRIGRELFRLGGSTDAMWDSLYRVGDLAPADWGRFVSVMDHAWDGIGSDADRWWA